MLVSSNKQAPNHRRQTASKNLALYYQSISGPKRTRVLGPVVGTKNQKTRDKNRTLGFLIVSVYIKIPVKGPCT